MVVPRQGHAVALRLRGMAAVKQGCCVAADHHGEGAALGPAEPGPRVALGIAPFLAPLHLRRGERIFVMWSGLKGAVPILLAAFADKLGAAPLAAALLLMVSMDSAMEPDGARLNLAELFPSAPSSEIDWPVESLSDWVSEKRVPLM